MSAFNQAYLLNLQADDLRRGFQKFAAYWRLLAYDRSRHVLTGVQMTYFTLGMY